MSPDDTITLTLDRAAALAHYWTLQHELDFNGNEPLTNTVLREALERALDIQDPS